MSGPPLTVLYKTVTSGAFPSVAELTQETSIATMAGVSLILLLGALAVYAFAILPILEKKSEMPDPQ